MKKNAPEGAFLRFGGVDGTHRQPRKTSQSYFLKGPIPLWWLTRASKLPGKATALGIALWWLRGMSKDDSFKLTGKALEAMNVSRDAATDGLRRLEVDELVSVERAKGKRPTVHIIL
jgi:hypothetical protein